MRLKPLGSTCCSSRAMNSCPGMLIMRLPRVRACAHAQAHQVALNAHQPLVADGRAVLVCGFSG